MGLVAHRFAGAAISYEHVRQGWRSCHLFSVLLLISFLTASHPAASQTPVQINQNFNSQGPGPRSGPIYAVQTADAPRTGRKPVRCSRCCPISRSDRIPILPARQMAASGSPTTAAPGGCRSPTSRRRCRSAASALDPTDPTGKTIIAGIGVTDNGEYSQFNVRNGRGGAANRSALHHQRRRDMERTRRQHACRPKRRRRDGRGNTILAATFEVQRPTSATAGYGLFRSTDGGATFSAVSGAGGTGFQTPR